MVSPSTVRSTRNPWETPSLWRTKIDSAHGGHGNERAQASAMASIERNRIIFEMPNCLCHCRFHVRAVDGQKAQLAAAFPFGLYIGVVSSHDGVRRPSNCVPA